MHPQFISKAESTLPNLPDFLIIGQEDWDEVWRRNQFLIAGLAHRFPATKFLYLEMPFDLSYGLRTGQIFKSRSPVRKKLTRLCQGLHKLTDFPNLYTLVPPKLLPDKFSWGERFNSGLQVRFIRSFLQQLGIKKPILWTQNPFAAALAGAFEEKLVIYDVTDDWTVLSGASPRFIERVTRADQLLTEKADCIITCSEYLYARKSLYKAETVLIPNGVAATHYAEIGTPRLQIAPRLKLLPRPVVGYTGSLHEARLDIDLICALARALPEVSLVFVGPSFLSPATLTKLARFSNIHLLGAVAYSEIPSYMQGFDILMLPHVVSAFTESLNPLKVFEYLASGLPVVATNVAGVREYAEVIRVAHSEDDFISSISRTLAGTASYARLKARALARSASWDSRLTQVMETLQKYGNYSSYANR